MEIFFSSFESISLAIVKVFLMGVVGYLGLHFRLLGEQSIKDLSRLLINVVLPCFTFSNIITRFNPSEFRGWWTLPLLQLLLFAMALGVGWLILQTSPGLKEKGEFLSVISFQNGSFLPIPLVAAIFPDTADKYFIYIFLFVLSWSVFVYSAGIFLISKKKWEAKNLKYVFNAPFVVTLVSIFLVLIGVQDKVPGLILDPVRAIGNCTVPLAMIVLGGLICMNFQYKCRLDKTVFFKLAVGKLLILPLFALLVIKLLGLSPPFAFIFFLQSTMPAATSLAIISRAYDADYCFIGQSIFYMYLCSIVTVPLYLSLYKLLIGW